MLIDSIVTFVRVSCSKSCISNAIGMDWDSEGNLYVASFDDTTVRKFGPDGLVWRTGMADWVAASSVEALAQ